VNAEHVLTVEEWRTIPGYPDYEVSNQGRVRRRTASHQLPAGYVLTHVTSRDGYLQVNLWKDGAVGKKMVHRLVLLAFIGACPEGQESRHFPDPDKSNNRLSNLRYGTPQENYQDKLSLGEAT